MPVIINGTTGLSGVSTVNLANGSVTQNILANGVAGTGPAFRVSKTVSAQSLTINVNTKILFDTVVFDTANTFSIANSRFTPTVAGYYSFSSAIQILGTATTPNATFFKNGSLDSYLMYTANNGSNMVITGSALIYLNGSTDYVEMYTAVGSSGNSVNNGNTFFSGFLARAA